MSPLLLLFCIVYMSVTPTFILCSKYPAYEPNYKYPVVRNKEYDFPTYTPLQFHSSAATPVSLPLLEIKVNQNDLLLAKNDGKTVQLVPYNSEVATLKGGPVFNDRYMFASLTYTCDGVPNNTRTGGMFDGIQFSIVFRFKFFKRTYKSFENATKYRDGLVTIPFPLIVEGNCDNPSFVPVQKVLRQVKKPNSTSFIPAKKAFSWLLKILSNGSPYYCYPGAYLESSGRYLLCSNDIHPSIDEVATISYPQYETFLEVLNVFGQPQVVATPIHPLAPRPLVEARSPVYVEYC